MSPLRVKQLVEKMGDKMAYAVGSIGGAGANTTSTWAGSRSMIPHAFVIDKSGAIAWHGHTQAGLVRRAGSACQGSFDIKKARQEAAAAMTIVEFLTLVQLRNEGTVPPVAPKR